MRRSNGWGRHSCGAGSRLCEPRARRETGVALGRASSVAFFSPEGGLRGAKTAHLFRGDLGPISVSSSMGVSVAAAVRCLMVVSFGVRGVATKHLGWRRDRRRDTCMMLLVERC